MIERKKILFGTPPRKTVFVCANPNGGWRVHKFPCELPESIHTQTKKEAIEKATEIARRHRAELKIQKNYKMLYS